MNTKHTILSITLLTLLSTATLAVDTLYDNRFKQWQEKAKTGDSFSQYSLGNAYLRGNEVTIDTSKAIHWFQEAAKQGHAKSEYKLGYLYYSGKGINKNYRTAFDWFKKAAGRDYSPAQFYVGKMYSAGQGTDRNYDESIKWLTSALNNGYTPAAKEIEKTQNKIQSSQVNEEESAPAATTPAKKIVVAKRTVRKAKTTPKKRSSRKEVEKFSVIDMLTQGGWMTKDNEPTEVLPSEVNTCAVTDDKLNCKTEELHRTTEYADINYKVDFIVGRINDDKRSFMIKNKRENIFVLPSDPDDPDVDPDNIPAVGIVSQVMKCKFESDDKIRCYNDDFQKVYFTR